ncbi:MAG: hypothetical protein LBL34_01005 [Clostridiales bacterium]|nr:hypothetical protein [Clostridiales bacterium]
MTLHGRIDIEHPGITRACLNGGAWWDEIERMEVAGLTRGGVRYETILERDPE